MRWHGLALVTALMIAGCGGDESASTVATSAEDEFEPRSPSQSELEKLGRFALLMFSETPWSVAELGHETWAEMVLNGSLAACRSLHAGTAVDDAMRAALVETPIGVAVPEPGNVDVYDAVSAFFIAGADAYCPDLFSFSGSDLDEGWRALTGGEPPSRPLRLPTAAVISRRIIEQLDPAGGAPGSTPSSEDLCVPEPISPRQGEVMDNGRADQADAVEWSFDWSECPGADSYQLEVVGQYAFISGIDVTLAETRYDELGEGSYISERNRLGWTWRVRARTGGVWGGWAEGSFDVEPVDTD